MSNRNPDARNERPEQVIPWAIEQWVRQNVHTNMPGIVLSYDPETKRAKVQPAFRSRLRDPERLLDKPPIVDVPVRQPATGGHLEHRQVDQGDVVWLWFSERGLDAFKAQWGQLADPPLGSFFAMRDAVAIPWGVEDITPARTTGWIVQNRDGDAYISLDNDTVRIVTGSVSLTISPSGFAFSGGEITHNGTPIDDTHVHSGITPGGSNTGKPV